MILSLEEMIGENGIKVPGLGVIVYKDGKEIYSSFLGCRTVNKKPVTRNTKFRVASVSKMFTVFTIMQLFEQGKLSLDSDASDFLNFTLRNPNFPEQKITIRMLASHTSTLRDGKIYSIPPQFTIEEFFNLDGEFYENGAHFAKTNGFSYANINYGILGTIIENVTGVRFDIYQRENILSQLDTTADYIPANLTPNDFELLGTTYQKKNPAGVWNEFGKWYGKADDFNNVQPPHDNISLQNPYAENCQQTYNLVNYQIGTNATIFSPQGGLRISFEELTHALEMLMNGGTFRGRQIISKNSIAEMLTSQWIYDGNNGNTYGGAMLNYGLGTYCLDGMWIGHTGVAFGMLAGLFFCKQNGFIYMANGTAIDEDTDSRSLGRGGKYVWEEIIMQFVSNVLEVPTL